MKVIEKSAQQKIHKWLQFCFYMFIFPIPSAYLSWTCVHLHFHRIIKSLRHVETPSFPSFSFPPSHKRFHLEATLLSAQGMFSLHIQYIICFAQTKTSVPYFTKWSQGSFHSRAYESVLTKTRYSSQAHPHSKPIITPVVCKAAKTFFICYLLLY